MDAEAEIKVPKHFDDRSSSYQQKLSDLTVRSEKWTNSIAELLESWGEFSDGLDELTEWVWSQDLELVSLQVMEEFANEFSSHQTRLKVSNLF